MNETNLAIAPKSSQSCLNCQAEIERVVAQIAEAEKELSLLRLSNKAYSVQDIERKKKLELSLDNLRSLLCELETASKFEVGMWVVKNVTPTPGQVKGLYLADSYPKVAVLYDGKEEIKLERPAQLTAVDQTYLEYIWTGEDYPKLIRRGDKKECVDLEVLAENYNSSINIRDTHRECEAEPEDIQLYNRQAIWCKKQYQKITRDLFPAGTKVEADDLIGQVLPYSERNPAYLQKVEIKLDDDTVRKFYPTEISVYQESSVSSGNKAKIIEFCSKPTIKTIPIADIRRNGGTQQRTGLNHEVVQEYAAAMRQGDKFPPVKLKYDGTNYWLTDGFHTTEAAWSIGRTSIEAEVSRGSQRDAILISVGVNSDHGLRRSNADKRRAVTTLLKDEEWGQWSDREIARRCKVSQPFVSKLRSDLTDNVISDNLRSYKDKHGNTSQMNTENIGSDNKQQVLTVEPENDNKSTNKQEALQIDSKDKPKTKTAVQPPTPDRKKLVQEFEIGQLVKLQLAHLDGASEGLKNANHSYGEITSLTENKCSFNLNVLDHGSFVVSPEDIQTVECVHFPVSFSPQEFIALMSMYKTKHQIELAIKKGVLN